MTTISASSTAGVYLTGGSFTNPVVINKGVSISGPANAVFGSGQPWTLVNHGSVVGASTASGVDLSDGGVVTNVASAVISGGNGISIIGAIGTVVNSGSIAGSYAYGVFLGDGGLVTNSISSY
ncbi:MAG TPA: hypothetical protein VL992_04295, partial [Tepidisphaeraceae bacterium]|nr:hypothetical protein [Tepidisphaeraceae bacterium]